MESYLDTIAESGRNLTMVPSVNNIVDSTWDADEVNGPRPGYPDESLIVLNVVYTGLSNDVL